MSNGENLKIYKTGSSSSIIYKKGDYIYKTIRGLNLDEINAFKKGIDLIENNLPRTLLSPKTMKEKLIGEDSYELSYSQNILQPWIDKEFISSTLLVKIARLILEQQEILIKHQLTFIDARPQNYFLARKPYVLVDIGSIKPLTKHNLESFRADFINNFVYPLLIEKNIGIPISCYFRGKIQNFQINPLSIPSTWSSLTLISEFIRRDLIDWASNIISGSSPEFISYLNEIGVHSKNREISNVKKSKKLCKRLNKIISRVSPSIIKKSNWDKYSSVHNESYTKSKLEIIDKFINQLDSSCRIADLGANLTTHTDPRIKLLIDNDLSICKTLEESNNAQIVLLIDIAEAMTAENIKEFKSLNCNGYFNSAVVVGIMHHIIIDYGLCIEAFYKALANLYENVLLEYPSINDPMVRLLLNKKNEEIGWDWQNEHLEICSRYFFINREVEISKTRTIFILNRK